MFIVTNHHAKHLAHGSAWRLAHLLEYGSTYRLIYAAEVLKLRNRERSIPPSEMILLRASLKSEFQEDTPPEIAKLLKAVLGEKKFDARVPTGNYNPSKTNVRLNRVASGMKYFGRVFIVIMLATELQKIKTAENWRKQLGTSSSGILGSVFGGWLFGARVGLTVGSRYPNPWVIAGSTIVGGLVGGAIGYETATGCYEQLYGIYIEG